MKSLYDKLQDKEQELHPDKTIFPSDMDFEYWLWGRAYLIYLLSCHQPDQLDTMVAVGGALN